MEVVAALLLLLINLLVTCFLISILYFLGIKPLYKQIESLRGSPSQGTTLQNEQAILPFIRKPENILPSIDDIPEEVFYAEEDPKYPTDSEVEEKMTYNDDPYARVDLESPNVWEQLRNLKSNASV
jgi:hypothetical protein